MTATWLVTGGAGFIGSSFVLAEVALGTRIVTLDALTYAGNLANLASIADDPRHTFVRSNITDAAMLDALFTAHRPAAVVHLAAESHVDRSIVSGAAFVETNVVGTFTLLEAARRYRDMLPGAAADNFRFVHVSTDEVYGSLGPDDPPFCETTAYSPNSPYAASKAASDHFVRAAHHTYGLPVITTHCSNNYGPRQFPEKLIPLMIMSAIERKPLPVYGDGLNVRDWIYVGDHCAALGEVTRHGRPGEVYDMGGRAEMTNIDVVTRICDLVDALVADSGPPRRELINYVTDRPGHDRRYAIDDRKIRAELGWAPLESFDSGLRRTVAWYLANASWVSGVRSGDYRRWLEINYAERLGGTP